MSKSNLWVIVIDTSSSMGGEFSGKDEGPGNTDVGNYHEKIEAAKEYALKQIGGITSGDVAVVSFDVNARLVRKDQSRNIESFVEPVKELQANGHSTNIGAALNFCLKEFVLSQIYRRVWVEVITDGLSNAGDPIQAANKFAEDSYEANVFSRIDAYLIDPTDEGETIAQAICEPTGGEVKSVTSSIKLDEALAEQRIKYQKELQKEADDDFQKTVTKVAAILGLAVVITGVLTGVVEKPNIAIPVLLAALLIIFAIVYLILAFAKNKYKSPLYKGSKNEDLGFAEWWEWKHSKKTRTYAVIGAFLCFTIASSLVFLSYSTSTTSIGQPTTATPTAIPSATETATPIITSTP